MSIEIPDIVQSRLATEQIVWLTVTRADSQPLPTPVWFLWDADQFVVYTATSAPKVALLRARPNVALNFNTDPFGGSVAIFTATAEVVVDAPMATALPGYMEKYREGIGHLGMTEDGFATAYTQQLRFAPTGVRTL